MIVDVHCYKQSLRDDPYYLCIDCCDREVTNRSFKSLCLVSRYIRIKPVGTADEYLFDTEHEDTLHRIDAIMQYHRRNAFQC